jgi:hypothetical protein
MGGACSTNEGEKERVQVIVKKARKKEAARKMDLGERGWGGVDLVWLKIGASSCECGNESSGSTKFCETIKWLHNRQPLE